MSFFSNVKASIDKYESDKLGIDDDTYARFTRALNTEQDIVNRSRGSAFTKELDANDRKRECYFRRIFYKLKNAENDSENPAMTAELISKIQVHLLSQYGLSLCQEANQKETAKIRGFITDIRKFIPTNLDDLEIANDLTVLETANDNYEKAYMARVAEKAALPSSSSLREATESAYLTISYVVATNANSTSAEQADVLKAKLCERLINEVNVLVKDFKGKAYASSSSAAQEEEITDETINSENQEV